MNLSVELENIYNNILSISSSRYVERVKNIIDAKYNCYGSLEELTRAHTVYQLLLKGRNKKSIIEALENNLEDILLYWQF